ncbi:transglycosylase SLT domain-containing protein [Acidisphaera sp. L21]|uniref:transglycosylase SLT domain-containing protein n=1 Tax=Acidisphaera sp. L21 TaxID=1641851 RepID=UPI00131D62FB|nr:transglycosylase SLT domain-containing protein [Acidisphaera sp. L21]
MALPYHLLVLAAVMVAVSPSAAGAKARAVAPVVQGPLPDDRVCQAAIQSAEQALHLPAQLLGAIGLVESGRVSPPTGRVAPWPWTINVGGTGYFYDTKDQAIAATQGYLAKGVQSIDVGCLQVNLSYHPTAFASLDQAFDPVANAKYAADFLTRLYAQSHLWATAAAAYHSQTPGVSDGYVRRVVAAWPLAVRYIDASVLTAIGTGPGVSILPPAAPACVPPDLSRYTPEFQKVMIQASLDHARLLAAMGAANLPKTQAGCEAQPIGVPQTARLRSARGPQIGGPPVAFARQAG